LSTISTTISLGTCSTQHPISAASRFIRHTTTFYEFALKIRTSYLRRIPDPTEFPKHNMGIGGVHSVQDDDDVIRYLDSESHMYLSCTVTSPLDPLISELSVRFPWDGYAQQQQMALLLGTMPQDPVAQRPIERVCCLLVLNLVSSTLSCIRQPRPRLRVLDVCGFV